MCRPRAYRPDPRNFERPPSPKHSSLLLSRFLAYTIEHMLVPFSNIPKMYKSSLDLVCYGLKNLSGLSSGQCSIPAPSQMLLSLLVGSVAVSSIYAQSAEDYISTERPIAKAGLLANIGSVAGADPGIVIASPSTSNPDYFYTWTRDSSLVFKAIIDQLRSCCR